MYFHTIICHHDNDDHAILGGVIDDLHKDSRASFHLAFLLHFKNETGVHHVSFHFRLCAK